MGCGEARSNASDQGGLLGQCIGKNLVGDGCDRARRAVDLLAERWCPVERLEFTDRRQGCDLGFPTERPNQLKHSISIIPRIFQGMVCHVGGCSLCMDVVSSQCGFNPLVSMMTVIRFVRASILRMYLGVTNI